VEELPLNGRNFAQLVYLVPGVTTGQPGENLSGSSTFNPRAASNFNALGSQANANGWLVDGISDNEYTFNTVIIQPSVESVQEFKVLTGTGVITCLTAPGILFLGGQDKRRENGRNGGGWGCILVRRGEKDPLRSFTV
jgi:hypothetical protein